MRVSAREMPQKSAVSATRKVLKDATVKQQLVAILEVNTQCLKITEKVSFNIATCERNELRLHFEWTKVN